MIRAPRDFGSGILFLSFAVAALGLASRYPLGSASRMGPGYVPILLGAALALIGMACVVRSFVRDGEPISGLAWKPLCYVTLSTILFGALIRGAGVALALVVLVLLSASASRLFHWPAATALASGLALFCVFVFIRALGLPIPIVGSWLGG